MNLDEYITQRCELYAEALEKLGSAAVTDKVVRDMAAVVDHLRSLYRIRRSAFSEVLLERIRQFSQPGANSGFASSAAPQLEPLSECFDVGKYYLSRHGMFRVTALTPFPRIEPALYPVCETPYFATFMLDEHNKLVKKRTIQVEASNQFAQAFTAPAKSAEAEISELTEKFHVMIEANHRKFVLAHGKTHIGSRPTLNKKFRVTHCYSCHDSLCSDLDTECLACGWIICYCGACGCGYGGDPHEWH